MGTSLPTISPTVDVIIELPDGRVVLITRRYPPLGFAWPGGFIDAGECAEDAARREALEETSLEIELTSLLGVYSNPTRDARRQTISMVYVARASAQPAAGDDAASVLLVHPDDLLSRDFAFDHALIAADYLRYRATGAPAPLRPTGWENA